MDVKLTDENPFGGTDGVWLNVPGGSRISCPLQVTAIDPSKAFSSCMSSRGPFEPAKSIPRNCQRLRYTLLESVQMRTRNVDYCEFCSNGFLETLQVRRLGHLNLDG